MILEKYLKKIGVSSYFELNEEEKETYKQWENALSGRRITDEDVKAFFDKEQEDILNKISSMKLGKREDIFLKMKLEFIRSVKTFLDGPRLEKEMTEKGINNLIEKI